MPRYRTLRWIRRLLKAAAWSLAGLGALVLVYCLSAAAISSFPVNSDWRQPADGVRIFVIDNGVHTDLVLPQVWRDVDWRDVVRPEDIGEPSLAQAPYLAFGWGDRDFYVNTPHWRDLRIDIVARALLGLGRGTVLHVSHLDEPVARRSVRPVMLTPDQYRRLAGYVRQTFALRVDGKAPVVPGYGQADSFYEAVEGYGPFTTCNEWTGRALRTAGVRMGAWTPLPFTVMRWL